MGARVGVEETRRRKITSYNLLGKPPSKQCLLRRVQEESGRAVLETGHQPTPPRPVFLVGKPVSGTAEGDMQAYVSEGDMQAYVSSGEREVRSTEVLGKVWSGLR